jgi:threonine dehydrogenase-like Zn-dependent dehydrogenase
VKAALLHKPGSPLSVEDIPKPELGMHDVLIKQEAAAICPSDLPLVLGMHMELRGYTDEYLKRVLPHIPGHENSGVVEKVGDKVKDLKEGDRVITVPTTNCGHCYFCNIGRDNLCPNSFWTGVGTEPGSRHNTAHGGGWVEYMRVPARSAFKLPDNVSCEEATIITATAPGFHGTERANIQDSDVVLVFGAGGVGLGAMHYSKLVHGASKVIGVDLVDYRLKVAKDIFSADYTINAGTEDVVQKVREMTDDRGGADVAFEAVGYTDKTVEQAIDALRRGGTLVHVGSYPKAPSNYGGWKELTIAFSMGYAREDYRKMLRHAESGILNLSKAITHRISLDEVNKGVEITHKKMGDPIRVVITKF